MDDLVVREARAADVPGMATAWLDAGRSAAANDAVAFQVPAADGLEQFLAEALEAGDDEAVLVAERDGAVVGFVAGRVAEPDPEARWQIQRELAVPRLFIDAVAVAEPFRRRGVGAALVAAVEAWGRGGGAVVAVVDGNWHDGVGAGFYEAGLGYRRRALTLRKPLRSP